MDQTNKKVITVGFLGAGLLTAYVLTTILTILEASVSFFARLAENDLFTHGFPVGMGILVFLFLQFNPKTVKWADEVITEIRKMVWRTMKDTVAVTIAVCIMVIISGILLGLLDFISGKVINYFISL
jgi:preprotein translocase subunit SecE